MKRIPLFLYLSALTTGFVLIQCANPVSPEGGPKDVKPPQITSSSPKNSSVRFKGNTIKIDFDEFINLKNPLSEIMISPPLKEIPDYRLRGKSMIIKLPDTLQENTTYSINFGKAINDITENNVLNGWTYVFSTGDYVDSLSLKGTVVNAFDLMPQKDVFAILYINNNDTLPFDSLPLKVPPYYRTKVDENGEFTFNNLQKSDYKLMAISDQNNDFIFNQPAEKTAFLDSLIRASYFPPHLTDSLKEDTSKTIKKDSLKTITPSLPTYELRLFDEPDSSQHILKTNVPREGMVVVIFKYPLKQLRIQPLNTDSISQPLIQELSQKSDSLTIWLKNFEKDSLMLRISDQGRLIDTARIDLKLKTFRKKSEKKDQKPDRLGIKTSVGSGQLNQFKNNLTLEFTYPLERWNFSNLLLVDGKDTVKPKMVFSDSLRRKIFIPYKWKEEQSYTLIIPDSSFFGLNQLTNDSLVQGIKTKATKEFGSLNLKINIDNKPGQYLIQLLSEKEILVEEQVINQSGKVKFEFINPGKFKVKAILDRNRNQKWDTGNYRKKLQPEIVNYFSKTIEIRANWDVEENWDL